jgi:hypothetical protein
MKSFTVTFTFRELIVYAWLLGMLVGGYFAYRHLYETEMATRAGIERFFQHMGQQ